MHRRGFTLTELAVSAAVAGVTAALAGPVMMSPEARRAISLRNMHVIGAAGGSYRLDNDDYLPIEGVYGDRRTQPPGEIRGWCGWTAGGKNNSSWWPTRSRMFDIEAADRPLNAYAMPGREFFAPPPPARLPAFDPARLNEQAPVFKDPGDSVTHQRQWPEPTSGTSCYDDVGTSYFWNATWWGQLDQLGFAQAMAEGTRRMARGDGARPDRFVWMHDEYTSIIVFHSSSTTQIRNGYGDINKSLLLMIDGRAGYFELFPGKKDMSFWTPNFALMFE